MIVVTALTHFGPNTFPIRRLKAAQLAALRVFGEGVILESFDAEAAMQGKYRLVTEAPEQGEYQDAKKRHTLQVFEE